ncbi:2-hydroxychromene-2-carboxylate isomerase [Caenimonas sp. SL110]|uniref:2-hydroxychromene-2-carboxylate isomerase n=1 Tax=Caenimonas sp. SL110 TaxID=1450524 RepID=UPI0006543911|nr:2-hydroxychromene-2-carboxylate isomerase [Caenimonas sp. SL110]
MPSPLHFHFDFISPYGWLASLRIAELAARHGRDVNWNVMLLGVSVLKVMGLKPLLDTPLKGDYVRRDIPRHIRKLGLKMERDLDAPVSNPLPAARAFCLVKHHHPHLQAPMAQALYHAYWAQGKDLSTPQAVASVQLPDGMDAKWLETEVQGEFAATLLRREVDASLRAGVFGSPTFIIDGEMFWGYDRLPDVEEWLATGGW